MQAGEDKQQHHQLPWCRRALDVFIEYWALWIMCVLLLAFALASQVRDPVVASVIDASVTARQCSACARERTLCERKCMPAPPTRPGGPRGGVMCTEDCDVVCEHWQRYECFTPRVLATYGEQQHTCLVSGLGEDARTQQEAATALQHAFRPNGSAGARGRVFIRRQGDNTTGVAGECAMHDPVSTRMRVVSMAVYFVGVSLPLIGICARFALIRLRVWDPI